jgi:hypothetical protein
MWWLLLCAAVLYLPSLYTQVPVACATYLDDMYVDYNLAQDTLEGVAGVKQWVTNEFKHRWVAVAWGCLETAQAGLMTDGLLLCVAVAAAASVTTAAGLWTGCWAWCGTWCCWSERGVRVLVCGVVLLPAAQCLLVQYAVVGTASLALCSCSWMAWGTRKPQREPRAGISVKEGCAQATSERAQAA